MKTIVGRCVQIILQACAVAMPMLGTKAQVVRLGYADAEALMLDGSDVLKVAEAGVTMANFERRRVNALWWPQLQANGMYAHLSEQVEVRQPLSRFTDPAKAYVQSILPSEQLVTGLLDRVGAYTLTFPLLPQNIASVGITAEWIAFSGGKRWYADRMARSAVDVAENNSRQVADAERVALVERYYGLVLAQQTEQVCHHRYEALMKHYRDAQRLESVGMIDKAARMFAQVNMEEAAREWSRARSVTQTAQASLKQQLGMADSALTITPTSSLFVNLQLPELQLFTDAMCSNNPALGTLRVEELMARDKLRMDQGGYLPDVALFGKQTLYTHGLPSNLLPRTIVGVGFTWNLFDGLERESQIAQTRLAKQALVWSREEAESELAVAVTELYATLQRTSDEVKVLDASIALNEELVRMRRIAFAEGMATSAEVIDAENALSEVYLARLAAYYAYDVGLANLLALCGMTEEFGEYIR